MLVTSISFSVLSFPILFLFLLSLSLSPQCFQFIFINVESRPVKLNYKQHS